jgi:hypothetical protein
MPRSQPRWAFSFESSDRLRDAERGKEEGGEECSRGNYCSGRRIVTEGSERKILPARTYGAFCESCRTLIASCLSELPPAYVRLAGEIGEPSSAGTAIRSPFGPRLPLRADVDALMRAIAETLLSWDERVRTIARLSVLDTQRSRRAVQAGVVTRSAGLLGAHLTVLLALEPGPMVRAVRARSAPDDIVIADLGGKEAGEEILWLHRSALMILGEIVKQREPLDGVPCKRCEEFGLERAEPPSNPEHEAMWSECSSCRHQMTKKQFEDWSRWYSTWAARTGLGCRRCALQRHDECIYANCACRASGHVAALSVA